MNPLDPHNILPAHSDEVRRAHERNVAQPWSLLVACGMVGSVFFWGMVAVVVSGYFVPGEIANPVNSTLKPPPPPKIIRMMTCRPGGFTRIPTPVHLMELEEDSSIVDFQIHNTKEPRINEFIFVEEEPRPLNMTEIVSQFQYPHMLRNAAIKGFIVVRILVGKEGQYIRHKVINQPHPLLAEEVEKHIPELRFTPAIQDGKAIKSWVNVPFRFEPLD